MPSIPNPSEMLRLILERITDAVPAVQIGALHASITLSETYSKELLSLGVLSLVTPIVSSYITSEQLYGSKQEQLLCHSLVSNSLYLITSLCTQVDSLLEDISGSDLVSQCIQAVSTQIKALVLPALDLLSLCVEDNEKLSSRLVKEHGKHFFALLTSLDSESKIAVVGLMTVALNQTGNYEELFRFALPVLVEMIAVDIHGEFNANIYTRLQDENFKAQENFWLSEAKAQQASLEVLTNLLSVDEDETPKVVQYLQTETIKNVARAATGVTKEIVILLHNFPELLCTMLDLQSAGFSCIQNFVLNTDLLSQNVSESWTVMIEHFDRTLEFQEEGTEFQENFIQLSEILSKNMCALCRKYPGFIVIFTQPRKTELIPSFLQAIEKSTAEISVNLLGVLAVLGKDPMDLALAQQVVSTLVVCGNSEDLEVNTEALNVFFDVFCDENYDEILANIGLIPMMTAAVSIFLNKILNCNDFQVKEHAQEAYENLLEFIKYKALHIHT